MFTTHNTIPPYPTKALDKEGEDQLQESRGMFNLNRYNPESAAEESRGRKAEKEAKLKHKKRLADEQEHVNSLVVAEEQPQPKKARPSVYEESIDDLINDEVALEDNSEISKGKQSSQQLTELEIQVALRLAKGPIVEVAKTWRLAPFLVENLQQEGFQNFFPIQALTIPDVIATERNPHIQVRDVCISAKTGSGKTLAYVLPILNSMWQRSGPRRLHSLVVLPSRELAAQVFQVIQRYLRGSSLRAGIATGQFPLITEQKTLTVGESQSDPDMLRTVLTSYDPGNLEMALELFHHEERKTTIPAGGWSDVDLLVCTPGRLLDHLDNTPGFTLQHLRFLVVDEADRLLSQSYNNWVDRIQQATTAAQLSETGLDPVTLRHGPNAVQLRKFLVSATLTRDPQKLASMRLLNPKHFDVHSFYDQVNKYSMPDTLKESIVECTTAQKPLVLISLLREFVKTNTKAIIFTSRLDSTHRLARLLQLMWVLLGSDETCVGEFSGALSRKERSTFLERCANTDDNLSVIVCSDAMSRGIDIRVDAVINYDTPLLAKTYVHRCGRTARAGQFGSAISLVKAGNLAQFHRMRELIRSPDRVGTRNIQKEPLRMLVEPYQKCVTALRRVIDTEAQGELRPMQSVCSYLEDWEIQEF